MDKKHIPIVILHVCGTYYVVAYYYCNYMCTEVLYKYLLYEILVVSLGYSFQGPGCTPVGGPCDDTLHVGWYWVMSDLYRYQHILPMSLQVVDSTWWLF